MTNHKQSIITINNKKVEIDNKCIRIIKFFNKIGIPTRSCCENNNDNGVCFIVFDIDDPSDNRIPNFIKKYARIVCCHFNIWVRFDESVGELLRTWTLEIPTKYLKVVTSYLILNYEKINKKEN